MLATGSLSSSSVYGSKNPLSHQINSNTYLIGLSGIHLVRNRFGTGGEFYTGRTESNELTRLETEILYFGPVVRYYVSGSSTGSLYPQMSVVYVNYFSRSGSDVSGVFQEEELTGRGFGLNFEFGYAYNVNRWVNFEVAMKYNIFYLSGKIENAANRTATDVDFVRTQLAFSIAFGILFHSQKQPDEN